MIRRISAVAVLLAVALGLPAAGQDKQADSAVTLTYKPSPRGEKPPRLWLSGTANFPDGTVLKLTLHRQVEIFNGNALAAAPEGGGGGVVEVKGKKFSDNPITGGPGVYKAVVQYLEDFQKPAISKELRNKVPVHSWEFQFPAWGDDLMGQLGPKVLELSTIALDAMEMINKVEKASAVESNWVKEKKITQEGRDAEVTLTKEAADMVKETSKLIVKLERSEAKSVFPASHQELFFTLRTMHGLAERFHWEAGKFAGAKSYHSGGDMLKTHRNEPFSFANLKKYGQETTTLIGREMALWIVKDLRRTEGKMRNDIQDAINLYGKNEGISQFADRLAKATVEDLNSLENDIRTAKFDGGEEWTCPVCKKKNTGGEKCSATKDCKGKPKP